MKVRLIWEFNDEDRRALALQICKDGLATREDCLAWLASTIQSSLDEVKSDNRSW